MSATIYKCYTLRKPVENCHETLVTAKLSSGRAWSCYRIASLLEISTARGEFNRFSLKVSKPHMILAGHGCVPSESLSLSLS